MHWNIPTLFFSNTLLEPQKLGVCFQPNSSSTGKLVLTLIPLTQKAQKRKSQLAIQLSTIHLARISEQSIQQLFNFLSVQTKKVKSLTDIGSSAISVAKNQKVCIFYLSKTKKIYLPTNNNFITYLFVFSLRYFSKDWHSWAINHQCVSDSQRISSF